MYKKFDSDTFSNEKGLFFQSVIKKERDTPAFSSVYKALGAIPDADGSLNHGFLPRVIADEVMIVPEHLNQLRQYMTVTQQYGLIVARLNADTENYDFVEDGETAREIALSSELIEFGRYKQKFFAKVIDTVLLNSPADLQGAIIRTLQSAIAYREKRLMFSAAPKTGEEHMSIYNIGVKTVTGQTMRRAILNAYADLEDIYRSNAIAVINPLDWVDIVESAGGSARDIDIIGMPVVLCDAVSRPVIGDFSYSHLNYEAGVYFDTDKDMSTGVYSFVVTAWMDLQHKLKAAFRVAEVG